MSRLRCCVPFCRRTRCDDGRWNEWLCGDHWRLVDRSLRALKSRAARRSRWWLQAMIWRRCKRQAIERAMGIAA